MLDYLAVVSKPYRSVPHNIIADKIVHCDTRVNNTQRSTTIPILHASIPGTLMREPRLVQGSVKTTANQSAVKK